MFTVKPVNRRVRLLRAGIRVHNRFSALSIQISNMTNDNDVNGKNGSPSGNSDNTAIHLYDQSQQSAGQEQFGGSSSSFGIIGDDKGASNLPQPKAKGKVTFPSLRYPHNRQEAATVVHLPKSGAQKSPSAASSKNSVHSASDSMLPLIRAEFFKFKGITETRGGSGN
jgi:hypothetical protein